MRGSREIVCPIMASPLAYCFQQIHLDVARNATDDFNPFHDPHRWHHIQGNPYGGPIVLGFQLAALADSLIDCQRQSEGRSASDAYSASHYEFHYAGALRPGEAFTAEVRGTVAKTSTPPGVANRVVLRRQDGRPILLGSRSDTTTPLMADDSPLAADLPPLAGIADRSFLPGGEWFLKRKFLTTSNGKNFLLGSLIDQHLYFDEIAERVQFPAMYTASLISCALLERARAVGYDFEGEPQVYVRHRLIVDRHLQQALRSNDRLDILVGGPRQDSQSKSLSNTRVDRIDHPCLGLIDGRKPLFSAEVQLASLRAILGL